MTEEHKKNIEEINSGIQVAKIKKLPEEKEEQLKVFDDEKKHETTTKQVTNYYFGKKINTKNFKRILPQQPIPTAMLSENMKKKLGYNSANTQN